MLSSSSRTVTGSLPVKGTPGGITAGGGFIWVTDTQGDSVTKVDPATHAAVDTIDVGGDPTGIAWGDGSIWVVESNDADVARIDPSLADRRAHPRRQQPERRTATASDVWVTNFGDDSVTRIDPATSKPVRGERRRWSDCGRCGPRRRLGRVDQRRTPHARPVRQRHDDRHPVATGPSASYRRRSVWVSTASTDPFSGPDRHRPHGDAAGLRRSAGVSAGSGSTGRQPLRRFDRPGRPRHRAGPADTRRRRAVRVGGRRRGRLGRHARIPQRASGGTLHVGGEHLLDTIDPATAYSPESWSILPMTNDGLVAFQRVGGPQGAAIVPDLATSIPQPSDGGRTLTFHLRPGIRTRMGRQSDQRISDWRSSGRSRSKVG